MQHTNQYQFNLIESGDTFSPQPLNENMESLDETLSMLNSTVDDLSQSHLKIAVGSYVGTGKNGASTPNRLTFPFAPKIVIIVADAQGCIYGGTIFLYGQTQSGNMSNSVNNNGSAYVSRVTLSWGENSVSWYSTYYPEVQMNLSDVTYRYLVIG